MLDRLYTELPMIAQVIESEPLDSWATLHVTYEKPHVKRLWRPWTGGGRLFLHELDSCARGDALIHNHAWPSAILVVSGSYGMDVWQERWQDVRDGASDLDFPPPVSLDLDPGSRYEMPGRNAFHRVYPYAPTLSIMLTGERWADGEWTTYPPDKRPQDLQEKLTPANTHQLLWGFRTRLNFIRDQYLRPTRRHRFDPRTS